MIDVNDKIVICKHCGKPEYWGEMRWKTGKCMCRNCYKSDYESETGTCYNYSDLDGKRPTMEEFNKQLQSKKRY